MRDFAKHLIMREIQETTDRGPPPAFRACDKLRPRLATMMGEGGFRALILRALALANTETPWLRAARVKPDGALEGLEEIQAKINQDEFLEGSVVLLAQLLGLLETFIGPNLTSGLVGEIWPDIPLKEMAINNVHQNVKTR